MMLSFVTHMLAFAAGAVWILLVDRIIGWWQRWKDDVPK